MGDVENELKWVNEMWLMGVVKISNGGFQELQAIS